MNEYFPERNNQMPRPRENPKKTASGSERKTIMRVRCFLSTLLLILSWSLLVQAQAPVDKAWNILKQGAADKNADKRVKTFRALALAVQNQTAQQMAESALGDEKPNVRIAAASSLGQMGAKSSVPKLVQLVKADKDAGVVFAATDALFRLGDPGAYHVYYAVLLGEKKTGEGLVDSQMKMLKDPKAMANMGFEVGIGFIPFAGVGYGVFKVVSKDDVSPIRAAAAMRLAGDPDPKSGEALAKSAADSKWIVRAAVVDAIAKRGDPSLLKAVVPLLDDDNDAVKFSAAAAVIRLSAAKR
jgi:HEAT repeat protein